MARATKPKQPPTPASSGTVYQDIDPHKVDLGPNPRSVADIRAERPDLVDSISRNGVVVPVMAVRVPGGDRPVVWDGQCRVLIAREYPQRCPTIGVVVSEHRDDELRRLVEQWVTAEHRQGWSTGDKAAALEQMMLFGADPETLGQSLGITSAQVRAATAARTSQALAEALQNNPQLSLTDLAALDEFSDDEDAQAELLERLVEDPDDFDHEVARQRHRRDCARLLDAKAAELTAAGVRVVETSESSAPLHRLRAGVRDDTRLTEDNHADCPGHAATVAVDFHGIVDVDWVCADWREHGHHDAYQASEPQRGLSEYDKGERKRAKTNNAEWRAALEVRRDKLPGLLADKIPTNQALRMLVRALAHGGDHLTDALGKGNHYAVELLGLRNKRGKDGTHPIAVRGARATQEELLRLLLGTVLGGMEAHYAMAHTVTTWRSPDSEDRLYFEMLRDLGYTLSRVERLVLDPAADADQWPHLLDRATGSATSAGAKPSAEPTPDSEATDPDSDEQDSSEDTDVDAESTEDVQLVDDGPHVGDCDVVDDSVLSEAA